MQYTWRLTTVAAWTSTLVHAWIFSASSTNSATLFLCDIFAFGQLAWPLTVSLKFLAEPKKNLDVPYQQEYSWLQVQMWALWRSAKYGVISSSDMNFHSASWGCYSWNTCKGIKGDGIIQEWHAMRSTMRLIGSLISCCTFFDWSRWRNGKFRI